MAIRIRFGLVVLACVVLVSTAQVPAQQKGPGAPGQQSSRNADGEIPQTPPELGSAETERSPVEIDGKAVVMVYSSVGGYSPEERAAQIQQRIIQVARTADLPPEAIRTEDRGAWTAILAGNEMIMGITEADARIAGRPRAELASEDAEILRHVVIIYRQEHTWRKALQRAIYTVLATAGLLFALIVLFRIRRRIRVKLQSWSRGAGTEEAAGSVASRARQHLLRTSLEISRILLWIVIVAVLEIYGTLILSFYPSTRHTSAKISRWLFSELAGVTQGFIGYLPNLLVVLVICLAAYYLIRLNRYIFAEIRDEKVRVKSFYPEWAEPTEKLARVLILAGTAIVVFPYLPGSSSPAFRGISVFLGVLLSLGSTSAVAHAVAGTILTYMRSFRVGDFVKIGNDIGEVIEKTLLVTRIRTQKNEIVTIPNGSVLGGVVVNYSSEARDRGVIFHTQVSIGYNAPWGKVHELLIAAALSTADILHTPRPFVLQSALDDFYVSYELNAFTSKPQNMQIIYSDLHQNIQDKFNEGGIEINSPHYTALRDGNRAALPDAYLPANYETPAFAVREVKASENALKR